MSDEDEIRTLIGDHFEPMRWSERTQPDWDMFRQDFLPEALLIGAARPAQPRSVEGFIDRMETVARANIDSFEEHTHSMTILRFGTVAVVLALSKILENGTTENRDISAYLLVKTHGRWMIAAHAWDQMAEGELTPPQLR